MKKLIFVMMFLCISCNALSQEKRIRVLVPSAPGGGLDIMVRNMIIPNTTIIPDFRPGANGKIAFDILRSAGPDTVMIVSKNQLTTNNIDDLVPLAKLSSTYNLMIVHPDWDKKITSYGSIGVGSTQHIAMEHLVKIMKLNDIIHVPYKGTSELLLAVIRKRSIHSYDIYQRRLIE